MGRVNAPGGSARIVQLLQQGLPAFSVEASTVFPSGSELELSPWYLRQGLKAEFTDGLPRADARSNLRSMRKLFRFLRQRPYDVLNIHFSGLTISAFDVLAGRLNRKPVVVSVHSADGGHGSRSHQSTRMAANLASQVVAVSEFQKSLLVEMGVLSSQITVIPNGIDQESLQASASARDYRRGAEFVLGTMCRQEADKRVPDIARALADLPEFASQGRWLVAGTGSRREEIERQCRLLLGDRVEFLGHIEDHATYFRSLDAFAMVSDCESFGLTYAEAGLFGVPSLATNQGGAPEVVLEGTTGWLAQPGDLSRLKEKLAWFIGQPEKRRAMGKAAKRRTIQEYDAGTMVERYAKLYGSLRSSRRRSGSRSSLGSTRSSV